MEVKQTTNQDGKILNRHTSYVKAKSPLTDAQYEIRPKVGMVNDSYKVEAYVVSINMPACTVNNNALLDILVFKAALCARYMLQIYLLKNGCPFEMVQRVQLEHATIQGLTLTYLLPAPKGKTADAMNSELKLRARSLQPSSRMRGLSKVDAYESTSRTVYLEHSCGIKVTAYVKDKPTPGQKAFCALPKKAAKEVFTESVKFLRVEATLGTAWLNKHPEFAAIKNWKSLKKAQAMQKTVFDTLRTLLGLDMQFRKRWPKPVYLQKLSPSQAEVLDAYKSVKKDTHHLLWDHPSLVGKSKQYVSKVKKALWDKLDIDIDVLWAEHARLPELKWFQYPVRYELPKRLGHLADYVFVRETVQRKLDHLRQMIAEHGQQSPNARCAASQAVDAPLPPAGQPKAKVKRKLTFGNIGAGLK